MSISIFGFQALWSPYFLSFILVFITLYMMIIGPWRSKFKNSTRVPVQKQILFITGMVLIYVCKGSPFDLLGHLMFSAHMGQMAILYLIVPPLLIVGLPDWFYRAILDKPIIKPVFKFFTNPLISLIFFNGMFSMYHIPLVFDFVKTNTFLHAITTGIIFFAAMTMWWLLVNPLSEWQVLSGIKKVGFIFADGVLLTPACALIIFADTSLYMTYSDPSAWLNALQLCVPTNMLSSLDLTGPQMFNSLPLVEDQQLGGTIMKVIQELSYGTVLGIIFFAWVRKEKEDGEVDPIPSQIVE